MKGSKRPSIEWPDGAKIAVIPAVCFETWPADLGLAGTLQHGLPRPIPTNAVSKRDLRTVWDRQFGERVGIFRLLELFEEEKITTTFFLNGITVERFPELSQEIEKLGHEIACEHWIHDYAFMKTAEEERESIRKTVAAFQRVLKHHPQGYLSTGIQPSEDIPRLIVEEGFRYWVDPQNDEIPYTLMVDGKELIVTGGYTGGTIMNDYRSYGAGLTPRELFQVWKDSFDYLYEEGQKGRPSMMLCGLHPFLTGRPARALAFRDFLRHAKRLPGVWFPRCVDVVDWWAKRYLRSRVEEWPNYHGVVWMKE